MWNDKIVGNATKFGSMSRILYRGKASICEVEEINLRSGSKRLHVHFSIVLSQFDVFCAFVIHR